MNWPERAVLGLFALFVLGMIGLVIVIWRQDPEKMCEQWIRDCAKNKPLRECRADSRAMGCL